MAGCLICGCSTNSCCSAGVVFPLDLRCDRSRLLRRHRCQLQEIHLVCSQAAGELRHMDGRVSVSHYLRFSPTLTLTDVCWYDCVEILWSQQTLYFLSLYSFPGFSVSFWGPQWFYFTDLIGLQITKEHSWLNKWKVTYCWLKKKYFVKYIYKKKGKKVVVDLYSKYMLIVMF